MIRAVGYLFLAILNFSFYTACASAFQDQVVSTVVILLGFSTVAVLLVCFSNTTKGLVNETEE